ncbi:MAG: hypothetical protein ABSB33_07980, partial [Tepidisphaeraceae bacterium]
MKRLVMAMMVLGLSAACLAQDLSNGAGTPLPSDVAARRAYASATRREQVLERLAHNAYQKALVSAQRQLVEELKDAQRTAERENRDLDAMLLNDFVQEEQQKLDALTGGWTATIQATQDWQHVVTLPRGRYLVTASGKWSDNPNTPLFGPEGDIGAKNPPVPDEGALMVRVNGRVSKVGRRAMLDLVDDENYVEMEMSDLIYSDNRGSVEAMITERGPFSPDQYLVADFAGAGRDGLAVLRGNKILYQTSGIASADSQVATANFDDGNSQDQYLVGDFAGIGRDQLAVRRGRVIHYQKFGINSQNSYAVVLTFGNGNSEDQYLVGDFTGIGRAGLAVRRGNVIRYQTNGVDSASSQVRTVTFGRGNSEDQYLVGDFAGIGRAALAVRRGNQIVYQTNGITSKES